jgi:hypothetical protein
MRMRNHTRLHLEPLEDRCTPCGGLGDADLPLDPIPHTGGHDQASLPESPSAASEEAGNVISTFARDAQGVRVLWGESTIIDGARVVTWALVSPHDNTILAAGVTFSLKLAEEMPQPGSGPAGAIASLEFPAVVQDTTFFNHLEIQSNPHGHEAPPGSVNPDRNRVAHFDFHFYAIPEEQVWAIPDRAPPLPRVPADLLAPGYTQAGRSVLQMGRHSGPVWALTDPGPLTTLMLAGYLPDGSQMHFLEPMVSQDVLLGRQDFSIPVPMPRELGRAAPTLYPTRFEGLFQGNAYSFVYSDFVTMPAAASAMNQAAAAGLNPAPDRPASQVSAMRDFSDLARLRVGERGDRTPPSTFMGLNVAITQVTPSDPYRTVSPAFAMNDGQPSPETLPGLLHVESVLENLARTSPVREVSPGFDDLSNGLTDGLETQWTWDGAVVR